MAVVDSFESMTATQFYRDAKKTEDAAFEIEKSSGKRYDPRVVEAFKKALPAMLKVREAYADALGDQINLDFAAKGAAAAPTPAPAAPAPAAAAAKKPALDAAAIARAAARKAARE